MGGEHLSLLVERATDAELVRSSLWPVVASFVVAERIRLALARDLLPPRLTQRGVGDWLPDCSSCPRSVLSSPHAVGRFRRGRRRKHAPPS